MCVVILNSHVKCRTSPHQTWSLWTGPCAAKQRPTSQNYVGTAL